MSQVYTTQQVEEIFQQLDAGNTKEATAAIKAAKQPEFGIACYDILMSTSNSSLKVHCALELRKSIEKIWIVLPNEYKQQMLTTILDRVVSETENSPRTAIANLVASIGKIAYNEWGAPLMDFLNNCIDNGDSQSREVAAIVFRELFSALGSQLGGSFDKFVVVMGKLLQDRAPRVQKYTFDALTNLSQMIENKNQGKAFAPLLHPLMNACDQMIAAYHPDMSENLGRAFSLFADLIPQSMCLGTPEVAAAVKVCVSCLMNTTIETDDRVLSLAVEVITCAGEERPKILSKEKLLGPVMTALLRLASLPVEVEDVADLDEDLYSTAVYAMDRIANAGAPRGIFSELVSICGPKLMSANVWELRGALGLVSVVSEGCHEPMKRHCASLCDAALAALKNSNHLVRMTSLFALANFAEHLAPEFLRFHQKLVPALTSHCVQLEGLLHGGAQGNMRVQVCEELDYGLKTLSAVIAGMSTSEIRGYIDAKSENLLSVVSGFLKRPGQVMDIMAKAFILFNAVAKAASVQLEPFSADIIKLALPLMQMTPEQIIASLGAAKTREKDDADVSARELIGYAIMCVGAVISATPKIVGGELEQIITLVMACAEKYKDDSSMMTCIIEFVEDTVVGMRMNLPDGAVAPFVQLLLKSANAENLQRGFCTTPMFEVGAPADEDDDDNFDLHFDQTVSHEVNAAMNTLRRLYWIVPAKVHRLTGEVLKTIMELTAAVVPAVAENACETLSAVVHGFHKAEGLLPFVNNDGRVVNADAKVTPIFMEVLRPVYSCIWQVAASHNSMDVVATAVNCLASLLKTAGPSAVASLEMIGDAYPLISKFLAKKHACQVAQEDDDVDDEEESSNDENYLFDCVSSLCGALAAADNARFMQYLKHGINGKASLGERLMKLVGPKATISQRDMGISFFAEIVAHLTGDTAPQLVRQVVDICMLGAKQREDLSALSNSLYTLGITAEVGGAMLYPRELVHKVLSESLGPIVTLGLVQGDGVQENVDDINITADELHARDNAIGSICRFIMALPADYIPLEQVLPPVLAALPLREDCRESITVLRAFRHMTAQGGAAAQLLVGTPERKVRFGRLVLREFFQPESLMEEDEVKQIFPFVCEVAKDALTSGSLTAAEVEAILANAVGIDNEAFTAELFANFRATVGL